MKKYEITFIVTENLTEDKAKEAAKEVKKLIESFGAKFEKDFFWGKRKLVYKIKGNSFGYYFIFIFDLDPSNLNKISEELNLSDKVIRYLLVDFVEDSPFFEENVEGGKEKIRKTTDDKKTPRPKKEKTEEKIEEEKIEESVEP